MVWLGLQFTCNDQEHNKTTLSIAHQLHVIDQYIFLMLNKYFHGLLHLSVCTEFCQVALTGVATM